MKTHHDKPDKREMTLPYYEYEELLEDLHDLATISRAKNEPSLSCKNELAVFVCVI